MKVCIKSMKGVAKIVRSRNNKSDAEFWNVYNFIDWFDGYNCYCYNKRQ